MFDVKAGTRRLGRAKRAREAVGGTSRVLTGAGSKSPGLPAVHVRSEAAPLQGQLLLPDQMAQCHSAIVCHGT